MQDHDVNTLQEVFKTFRKGFFQSQKAQSFFKDNLLKEELLKESGILIGYNSGRLQNRRSEASLQEFVRIGILTALEEGGYRVWGRSGIVFPLLNKKGDIVNLYSLKITEEEKIDVYFNTQGLFPIYPKEETKYLILTADIVEACLLIQAPSVSQHFAILATDGYALNILNKEVFNAIKELNHLEEIILFPSQDFKTQWKFIRQLQTELPNVTLSTVAFPDEEESLKDLLTTNSSEIVNHLIEKRTLIEDDCSFNKASDTHSGIEKLNTSNPFRIAYNSQKVCYHILGGLGKELDSLRITLMVENKDTNRRSRRKLDLYEETQVERTCEEVGEKLRLRSDVLGTDLAKLTDLLDSYRNKKLRLEEDKSDKEVTLPVVISKSCKAFLSEPDLLTRINELIEKGGVVGEVNNRLFLFIVASSYKMTEPLNALL